MTESTEWIEDHFIAGNLALDFANTVYRRWPEPGPDLFTDTEALGTWLSRTRLLSEDARDRVDTGVLAQARALRALLWTTFDAVRERRPIPSDAFGGLLDIARASAANFTVHSDGTRDSHNPSGALAVASLNGITLALNPPPQGVRACDRCGWFFIDSSRGRRRRWCSMKTCGNQAKAARYRSSHA